VNPGESAQLLLDMIVEESHGYDDMGRRIIANKLIRVLSGWLPQEKKDRAVEFQSLCAEPMTYAEAREVGRQKMEFGKFAGTPIDEVDRDYLAWLADSSRATWIKLNRYLKSGRVVAETDNEPFEPEGWD
jgi:hypothetical protein